MDIKTLSEKLSEKLDIDKHNIYFVIPRNKELTEFLVKYKIENNIKYGEVAFLEEVVSSIKQYGFEEEIQ